jgi:hypothetical protein
MMETVLNIGLTTKTIPGLIKKPATSVLCMTLTVV